MKWKYYILLLLNCSGFLVALGFLKLLKLINPKLVDNNDSNAIVGLVMLFGFFIPSFIGISVFQNFIILVPNVLLLMLLYFNLNDMPNKLYIRFAMNSLVKKILRRKVIRFNAYRNELIVMNKTGVVTIDCKLKRMEKW